MTAALFSTIIRLSLIFFAVALLSYATTSPAAAHPLGNFTINHFTRIDAGLQRVRLHYVIDMAEIPAFQATQGMAKNSDGSLSPADLNVYLEHVASRYAAGLLVTVNGKTIPLQIVSKTLSLPRGSGGLYTLRVECDFAGDISGTDEGSNRRFHFEDRNNPERIGWHEIVVTGSSAKIFNSSAFGSQVTDELKVYPEDMLTAPLDERIADFPGLQNQFRRAQPPCAPVMVELLKRQGTALPNSLMYRY